MNDAALTLLAALAAGLAGAAHCAAMCGGIATAAGATFRAKRGLPLGAALAFNAGRLVGYALVGAALGAVSGVAAGALPIASIAVGGRIVAALVLAALGLRLLTGRDLLGAERLGALAWGWLRPAFGQLGRLPAALRPVALGLLWGFMPCGLVYSMLLIAAASADPATAAATMMAFGAGTLPALLGLTLGGATLGRWLNGPRLRRGAGVLVLGAAAWTLAGALMHRSGAAHDHAHLHLAAGAIAAGPAPRPIASRYPNP